MFAPDLARVGPVGSSRNPRNRGRPVQSRAAFCFFLHSRRRHCHSELFVRTASVIWIFMNQYINVLRDAVEAWLRFPQVVPDHLPDGFVNVTFISRWLMRPAAVVNSG